MFFQILFVGLCVEDAKTPIGLKIVGSERRRREEAHRALNCREWAPKARKLPSVLKLSGVSAEGAKKPIGLNLSEVSAEGAKKPIGIKSPILQPLRKF